MTILTGLMSMLCLVCPLRNGGSSSTSSISRSSSEMRKQLMKTLERRGQPGGHRVRLGGRGSGLFHMDPLLTLFIIDFRKNPSLIIKIRELFLGQDVGSNHLWQRQKMSGW